MAKMSLSGSDSEQYLNVEPPGISGFEVISIGFNSFWYSKGVHITVELKRFAKARK